MQLSENYWDDRYKHNDIGWDIGYVSNPLKAYFDQLNDKNLKILIPGSGHSHEAEYLFNKGFKNVFVADLSETALNQFSKRVPNFPKEQLLHANFFNLEATFDLIIEQTFFCALHPELRLNYAKKVYELLKPSGKLVGVLFNIPLNETHPPFGGNKAEYHGYFKSLFNIKTMEPCYNSISKRANNELFFICIKS
ncbi:methyltransferase domain-containing protein [Gaetbulibacter saemankumensis]|uniref:methyltransferase domain-containing protein n=1 Tax=Gaetbulibacter saemankumensis TaxID=311208 RepID=UPI00040A2E4F|nr:methyltransferase domain-containing protein [Gaetbulibacter saemankumensis]